MNAIEKLAAVFVADNF